MNQVHFAKQQFCFIGGIFARPSEIESLPYFFVFFVSTKSYVQVMFFNWVQLNNKAMFSLIYILLEARKTRKFYGVKAILKGELNSLGENFFIYNFWWNFVVLLFDLILVDFDYTKISNLIIQIFYKNLRG